MKYIIYSFFLLITVSISAQEINQLDANGKRDGVWRKTFKDSNVLRYEGQFNHGKAVKTFKFYEAINNKPVLIASREFNTKNNLAQVTFYSTKGNVISKGKMREKTYVGEWLYFHKDSKTKMTQEFYNNNGELNGDKKVFYISGKIAEKSNYVNGNLEGESIAYSEKGKILRVEHYKNNMFHGLFQNYDIKGNLITEGYYSKDLKTGVWKYYQDGKLVEEKDLTRRSKNPYKKGKK